MSTQAPAPGFAPDPTIDPVGSPNLIGPKLPIPHLGIAFDKPRPWWFVLGIMLGQLGIFIALMGPATVSIQIKASQLASSPAEAASITAFAVAPGALAAVIFNALGGRISDRSTSRFGRRRPWLIVGALGMLVGLALIALAPGAALMAVGWFLAQAAGNLALAAYVASIADQLSPAQYGRASGLVGIAGNLAVMIATWLTSVLTGNMIALFLVPGLIGMVLVLVFAFMLPEPVLRENRLPFNLRELVLTFWRNPVKFPDFGLAWGGRFTIILASFMFTTFRVLYMENHLGLDAGSATLAVATGVTIYTVTSMVASLLAGWLSDLLADARSSSPPRSSSLAWPPTCSCTPTPSPPSTWSRRSWASRTAPTSPSTSRSSSRCCPTASRPGRTWACSTSPTPSRSPSPPPSAASCWRTSAAAPTSRRCWSPRWSPQ